jgi:hypothetical protein
MMHTQMIWCHIQTTNQTRGHVTSLDVTLTYVVCVRLVGQLFRGEHTYVTMCLDCKTVSERREAFDELELQLDKRASVADCIKVRGVVVVIIIIFNIMRAHVLTTCEVLTSSPGVIVSMVITLVIIIPTILLIRPRILITSPPRVRPLLTTRDRSFVEQAYLEPEYLVGDNRYLCGSCGVKKDASRRIALSKLPPILNVHLMRYVFDAATGQKKKVRLAEESSSSWSSSSWSSSSCPVQAAAHP